LVTLGLAVMLIIAVTMAGVTRHRELALFALQAVGLSILPLIAWKAAGKGHRSLIWPTTILLLTVLVLLLQLVPIPFSMWIKLPGREIVAGSLELISAPPGARPLSLTPDKTVDALFWLIPPVIFFLGTAILSAPARIRMCTVFLTLMGAGLALGALQVTTDIQKVWSQFDYFHPGLPIGFFANRNHQAIALAVCLPLLGALTRLWSERAPGRQDLARMIWIGATGLIAVGMLATLSRAGSVLGSVALVLSLMIFAAPTVSVAGAGRRRVAVLIAVGVVVVVAQLGLGAVLSRFDNFAETEGRFKFWPAILAEAEHQQPFGSGTGSFDAVFRSVERTENLGPNYVNEAHNEYLQLWMELGLFFPILFGLFLVWVFWSGFRVFRHGPGASQALGFAALSGITVLLLHSVVDYPLRTQSLAVVFALLCGCLVMPPPRRS